MGASLAKDKAAVGSTIAGEPKRGTAGSERFAGFGSVLTCRTFYISSIVLTAFAKK